MRRLFLSRYFHLLAALAIALLTIIAYSNTFQASFHFDDHPQIIKNNNLKSINLNIIKETRGLTYLTFAVNYALGGLDVTGYHIVNTSVHIINSILAYWLLIATFGFIEKDDAWARRIAFFSALIFALHPIQTQAVTYIIQRMESLSSLFYLSALLFFVKAAGSERPSKRVIFYALVGASYLLGFYSKETTFTLPAIIMLYDLYFVSRGSLKKLVLRWPLYGALAALFIFFTVNTIMPLGGFGDLSKESAVEVSSPTVDASVPTMPREESAGFKVTYISPKEYLLTQFNVVVYYISLLAFPANQNLDYDFPRATGLFKAPMPHKGAALNIPMLPPVLSLSILLFILGLGLFLYFRSKGEAGGDRRLISFFIFWFFIILSPTSSLIPIIDVIYEHRLYLASLGFFTVFVILADMLLRTAFRAKEAPSKVL
ncbi:MAG: hypothetical protein Q7T24_02825 [Deltaproteobacteria bacterium]|nr:hypothetical protein [Deltaproteobacteria bacterium]